MRVILSFVLLLSACASHGVRCDGRLLPINGPAAISEPAGRAVSVTPRNTP
jgi:hypothetical protein